jgi:hypothetical protein
MTSQNLRSDIYDPKTLAVMDQAFAAIWNVLRGASRPPSKVLSKRQLELAGHSIARKTYRLHVRCTVPRRVFRSFTLLSDNYVACDDARERQEEGSLKLGEIVLVYRDRRLVASERAASRIARPCSGGVSEHP